MHAKQILLTAFTLFALAIGSLAQSELATTTRFEAPAIGVAATKGAGYLAFQTELQRGAEAQPLFQDLLQHGTPAARLYAALGLYSLDRERGLQALQNLTSDASEVTSYNGCEAEVTTVGAVAKSFLGDDGATIRYYLLDR